MQLRRFLVFVVIMLGILAAVTGCGGRGGGEGEAPAAAPEAAEEQSAPVVDQATAATITGQVSFTGTAPEPQLIRMDEEPVCLDQYTEGPFAQSVVVNENGTLQNVFVYVKEGLGDLTFPVPQEGVLLDQQGCIYRPHVLGIQVGQDLIIRNSDGILHNIHPMPAVNREFNLGQPTEMDTTRQFARPEVMIPVECDVHGWMKAYIGVLEHPYYAVTSSEGSFELAGLPAGEYVIEAWHEEYGAQTMTLAVGEQETKEVEFIFEASASMEMEDEHEQEAEMEGEAGHGMEMHESTRGGQVGMAMGAMVSGGDFHIELVSEAPGQYLLYLSDENRELISPEGYEGTLALINPDGSEIASLPLAVMADGLTAQGGPTDISQANVRISLKGPDLGDLLEMEFEIAYE